MNTHPVNAPSDHVSRINAQRNARAQFGLSRRQAKKFARKIRAGRTAKTAN